MVRFLNILHSACLLNLAFKHPIPDKNKAYLFVYSLATEQTAKEEKQTEKEHDTVEEKSPPTISNKKFSPKDLLPKGGGNHSIQKILGNIAQVSSLFLILYLLVYLSNNILLGLTEDSNFLLHTL